MEYKYNTGGLPIEGVCEVERYNNILVLTQKFDESAPMTNAIESIVNNLTESLEIPKEKVVVFSRIPRFHNYTKVNFEIQFGELCNPTWEDVTDEFITEYVKAN